VPHNTVRQKHRQQLRLVTERFPEPRLEFGLDKQQLRTACGMIAWHNMLYISGALYSLLTHQLVLVEVLSYAL
jgi:hypothetical protein